MSEVSNLDRADELSTGTPILELRGISKHYGGVTALAAVSIDVHRGEVVALVGDNGAGKSTLIKIISGIVAPTTGEFYHDGQPAKLSTPQAGGVRRKHRVRARSTGRQLG